MRVRMPIAIRGSRMGSWLAALSVFDAMATDAGLRLQLIREGNPLAGALYETNIVLFYGYKIMLPFVLCLLLRHVRGSSLLRYGGALAVALYSLVALYHLFWIACAAAELWTK